MKLLSSTHVFKFNYWKNLIGYPLFSLCFIDSYKIKKQSFDVVSKLSDPLSLYLIDIKYFFWVNFSFFNNMSHIVNFNYSTVSINFKWKKKQIMLNELYFIHSLSLNSIYKPKISQYISFFSIYKIHYNQLVLLSHKYFKFILFLVCFKLKYLFVKVLKFRKVT